MVDRFSHRCLFFSRDSIPLCLALKAHCIKVINSPFLLLSCIKEGNNINLFREIQDLQKDENRHARGSLGFLLGFHYCHLLFFAIYLSCPVNFCYLIIVSGGQKQFPENTNIMVFSNVPEILSKGHENKTNFQL